MKGLKARRDFSYEIVEERITKGGLFLLVKVKIHAKRGRNRVIDMIMDETDAIGFIEWWTNGSIIHKPKWNFYGVLILATSSR